MGSTYPETRHAMLSARYTLVQHRECRLCRRPVERWRTTNGYELDFDPMANDDARSMPHRSTCPVELDRIDKRLENGQPLNRFARSMRAAAVIVIREDGKPSWVVADHLTIPPATLRSSVADASTEMQQHLVNRFGRKL